MKGPRAPALLAIAGLASCAAASVKMDMTRGPESARLRRRHLSARSTITETLNNNVTGGSYYAQVSVGTPGQPQLLALDTGSSDVWLLSSNADLCTETDLQDESGGGCESTFDSSKSSTYKDLKPGDFSIQYLDETGADGDYISDNLQIGGATLKSLEMGLAFNASLGSGLIGIGYDINEASNSDSSDDPGAVSFVYPSIIDTMVSQGLIARKAYSLFLNDLHASTGSIIFGGLDSDKYHGNLLEMPVVPTKLRNGSTIYSDLAVAMTSFGVTNQQGTTVNLTTSSFKESVVLDSGTTITYIPETVATQLYKNIGAVDDSETQDGSGLVYVDCNIVTQSPKMTVNFGFGGASGISIAVPVSEVVFDLQEFLDDPSTADLPSLPFSNPCAFGIFSGGSEGPFILGDTFLRSAYVVYDLQSNTIAVAQTNFNSTQSSVVEFTASQTAIPEVSGVASSEAVTATSAALPGPGGLKTTSGGASATGQVTTAGGGGTAASATAGAATSSGKSKSAGVSTVPPFDGRGFVLLGISGVFALLGSGWLIS